MPATARRTDTFTRQLDAYFQLRGLWRLDPERYCVQRLGMQPSWQQRQALEAIAEPGARVSIRSGHNTGKTGVLGGIVLWFMECFDYARVPCTAPAAHQLRDALWGELAKWMRAADSLSQARGDHPRFWISRLFYLTVNRLCDREASHEWYAVARTSTASNPDALQGFHASDVQVAPDGRALITKETTQLGSLLFVVDEVSGVPDQTMVIAEGALASPDSRQIIAGNPTRNTGTLADSHRSHRRLYIPLHWRSDESPLCPAGYRERLVQLYGEGSNIVRVRADGEFPREDKDSLIPLERAEAALSREAPLENHAERRIGVDVAWQGEDRTTLVLRQGRVVSHAEAHAKEDPMETAGRALVALAAWEADVIYVDTVGIGAGVYARLAEIRLDTPGLNPDVLDYMLHRAWDRIPVVAVNVSERAPQRTNDDLQGALLRDYLWLEMAAWLRDDEPAFTLDHAIAEDLAGELSIVHIERMDSQGQIRIESKDAMKKRLARMRLDVRSPDLADGLGLTFAPGPVQGLGTIKAVDGSYYRQSASQRRRFQRANR